MHSFDSDDFLDDITLATEKLRDAGLDRIVAVDLTRESMGVPVVRVIVPGLEVYAMDQDRAGRRCDAARHRRLPRPKP